MYRVREVPEGVMLGSLGPHDGQVWHWIVEDVSSKEYVHFARSEQEAYEYVELLESWDAQLEDER